MIRKHYYLTGPSFTVDEKEEELGVKFEDPRALNQVTVSHAGFTIDIGENPPPAAGPA